MAIYAYRGLDAKGKKVRGESVGASESEVIEKLAQIGLFPLKLKEKKERAVLKLRTSQLIELIEQLEELTKSGLPIFESLQLLQEQASDKMHAVISHMQNNIESGSSLEESMEQLPSVFDSVACAFIKGGAKTGDIPGALGALREFLQRADRLKKQILGVMLYPALLGTFALVALTTLLLFAVPTIEDFVDPKTANLLTRSVLALSHLLQEHGFLLLMSLSSLIIAAWQWGGSFLMKSMNLIPPVKQLYTHIQLSRYASLAAKLSRAHLQLPEALQMARSVVSDRILNGHLKEIEERLGKGEYLGALFQEKAREKIIPPYFARMLVVGEESASVAGALERIGKYYTELSERRLNLFAQLLQPLLLILLGFFVALIMLAILMPMTNFDTL